MAIAYIDPWQGMGYGADDDDRRPRLKRNHAAIVAGDWDGAPGPSNPNLDHHTRNVVDAFHKRERLVPPSTRFPDSSASVSHGVDVAKDGQQNYNTGAKRRFRSMFDSEEETFSRGGKCSNLPQT